MTQFILTIEASAAYTGGNAPTLEILIGGVVVSSATVSTQTGSGYDLLNFELDYTGSFPSSLEFRFDGGSGDPGDMLSLESVRVNGQAVSAGDLTSTLLAQGATSTQNMTNTDHLFGRVEPTGADLGTTTITGTGGNDNNLDGTDGADVIDGLAGADRIRGLGDDDAINGGGGNDFIFGEGGNDIIIGGTGDDYIFGNDGDDLLYGQADNDYLIGGAGNDILNGGAGNDAMIGDTGDDIIFGEDGDDWLIGDSGADYLFGDAGNDQLIGGADNDVMYGGADADQMHGESGDDTIYGEAGADFITGGTGADTIDGGGEDDLILGGAGADIIDGGAGADTIYGGADNDTITGGGGIDIIDGEGGTDEINYTNAAAGVTVSLAAGMATDDGDGASDTLTNIENITGSGFADDLTGDTGANTIAAGVGNDILAGRGGVDSLDGGIGIDEASYASAAAAVTASLASNTAADDGDGSNDTFTDIENLAGSAYDDNLTGDGLANTLTANDGDDTVAGGGGIDTIDGGNGDDTLDGDAGNDIISGGIGNDTLNGGADNDTMYALDNGISAADADDGNINILNGGAGADTLHGSTGLDILNGGIGNDTIYSGAGASIITLLNNSFTTFEEDFTYSDGGFGGTDPAANADVNGVHTLADGNTAAGSLEIHVDQIKNNKSFSNGSGSWDSSITTDSDSLSNAQITFSYRHLHDSGNDAGEDSEVYFEFDGTTFDNLGGNSYLSQLTGSGGTTDTGWITVTIDLPDLNSDTTYNLSIGILHLGSNKTDEDAYVYLDDVSLTGRTGIFNGLNGGAGQDSLYGNDGGTDNFLFESGDENTNDLIYNFNTVDGDAIDLLSVLNGFYESVTDDITQFIQITNSGSDSIVKIDTTGSASFSDTLATIIGVTGLTDEAALEAAGTLLTPLVTLDIIGTPLPDALNGTGADEKIGGLASNDLLYGAGGADELYGFAGIDTAYYASAAGAVTASLASGSASNDGDGGTDTFNSIENLTGSAFGDTLTGDGLANTLSGLAGNDTLVGGAGNDILIGGAGTDSLTGGTGRDTADYTAAGGAVTASLAGGSASDDGDGGTDTFTTIENLKGSAFGDTLTGDANANVLSGLAGADTLSGGGGIDTLDGGAGTDTADYTGAAGAVTVDLSAGAASDDGDGSADTFISIENVTGSANADILIGDSNANTLSGGNGADTLTGKGGTDVLNGGGGIDTANYITAAGAVTASLAAGAASNDGDGGTDTFSSIEDINGSNYNDTLTGDTGSNTLTGNQGSDTLSGGDGDDTLYGLGDGVTVATTLLNQTFSADLGTFTFAGAGTYFTNDLDVNDNTGDAGNSAHINLGRNGGPPTSTYSNLSGTYSVSITFTQDTDNVDIDFAYNITSTDLDAAENPTLNVLWDGGNVFTDNITPAGGAEDSGWLTTTISLGTVSAGTYVLDLQGFLGTSGRDEDADFYFDDIVVSGDVGSATGDAGETNTLSGGDGLDTLYGSDGIDIFVFESASAFNDVDLVNAYTAADGDALDIADILDATSYNAGVDTITEWVQITDDGTDSTLFVDRDGTGGTYGFDAIATILGVTGLTDEVSLEAAGNLIDG